MKKDQFISLVDQLVKMGYKEEIDWQRNLGPCKTNFDFANEAVWVILNSGMKEQIARQISRRIYDAIDQGKDISTVFGHKGKVKAIKFILSNSGKLFEEYVFAEDKITYLQTIPFIGKITCYHLAKNLGHDVVKPDRHLVRIADKYKTTPDKLCEKLARETGEKKATIDIVIWRACNLGIL